MRHELVILGVALLVGLVFACLLVLLALLLLPILDAR